MARKYKKFKKSYRKKRYGKKRKITKKFKNKVMKAVNMGAETKVINSIHVLPFLPFNDIRDEPGTDIIDDNLPPENASREGHLGVQYFVKSVAVEIAYGQLAVDVQHLYGLVSIFFLTERSKGSHRPISAWLTQVMNGWPNSFEPSSMQLIYSKVKRYDFRLGPQIGAQIADNNVPPGFTTVTTQSQKNFIFFRKTIKYNRLLKLTNLESNWPSTYVVAIRWNASFTRFFGAPEAICKLTMKFTDV